MKIHRTFVPALESAFPPTHLAGELRTALITGINNDNVYCNFYCLVVWACENGPNRQSHDQNLTSKLRVSDCLIAYSNVSNKTFSYRNVDFHWARKSRYILVSRTLMQHITYCSEKGTLIMKYHLDKWYYVQSRWLVTRCEADRIFEFFSFNLGFCFYLIMKAKHTVDESWWPLGLKQWFQFGFCGWKMPW